MNMKKLQEGSNLAETIQAMKEVEDTLRSSDLDTVKYLLIIFNSNRFNSNRASISVSGNLAGKFVIEKMLEAGIYAAMTVRAMAENNLEKL